jgi:hypothetical protein
MARTDWNRRQVARPAQAGLFPRGIIMDPISFSIELELGHLILAVLGGIWTYSRHLERKADSEQRERHHQDKMNAFRTSGDSAVLTG